jgi:UDP-N-acetylglucosamine/UDP-N-acetylgalactosamine diphosphorylase
MVKARNEYETGIIRAVEESSQQQLLRFWNELTDSEKDELIGDIEKVNFQWVQSAIPLLGDKTLGKRIIQKPDVIAIPASEVQIRNQKRAFGIGEMLIREGKTAVFTAAGGQSSRLGLETPKGCYPVSPIMHKSLFQMHAEKIAFLQNKYGVRIPWLIMVSQTNHTQTRDFFEQHGYFGLHASYVRFLEQGMFPAMDAQGKLLLKERNRVFLNPTGHGGTFSTLADSDALLWLKDIGVQEVFYFQVDNVLIKMLDPVFLGHHAERKCEMSSKCVMKRDMTEKIGVFVIENGTPTVVEYSELSSIEIADNARVEDLRAGNIAIHIINVDFAQKITKGGLMLPLHVAHKAVPHVDRHGRKMQPSEPNAYKFETFIFDALGNVNNTIIMEAPRHDEFSPLKNKTGEDSPETVLRDQLAYYASWFEQAGIDVPRDARGQPLHLLEVSPLFAAYEEDFVSKVDKGIRIEGDTYIA